MKKFSLLILIFILSSSAFAGNSRAAQMAVVSNLVNALNYNKYEQFIKDGSPVWRKKMTRSNYKKLHTEMINYIGHIVSWKPLSKKSKNKIDIYTFRLIGDSESIGLIMRVYMYVYKDKLLVHDVAFVKR